MSLRIVSFLFKPNSFKINKLENNSIKLSQLFLFKSCNGFIKRNFSGLCKLQYTSSYFFPVTFQHHLARSQSSDTSIANSEKIEVLDDMVSNNDGNNIEVFVDYGLGGGLYPHHLLQNMLEIFHNNLEIGWIPTISLMTILLRFLATPTYIKMRQFNVRSYNCFPEQMRLQFEMLKCNPIEKQKKRLEFMEFLKKNNLNPIKPLFYAAPISMIFVSFFSALRGIAAAKLPSFVNGGTLWFHNLTIPDPYYILPIITCFSLYALIKSGAATSEIGPAEHIPFIKKLLPWFPVVLFPFAIFQPSCMFVFWLTSNFFSIVLMLLFQNPKVKNFFNIPKAIVHPPSTFEILKAGSLSSMEQAKVREEAIKKVKSHFKKLKNSQDSIQ